MKDLFSPCLILDNKGTISRAAIYRKINHLLRDENREKPLTDQTIADMLNKNGIKISRRTIAKYRDKLKISSSFLR